ncbi:MAG: DUF4174 domain-containing protein [Paracoccaceae bacterium]
MKRFLILGLVALLGLPAIAQDADAVPEPGVMLDIRDAADVVLADFMWLNRLIVVFADTDRDPAFQRQMELLSQRPEALFERDVVVIVDTNPAEPSEIRTKLRPRGFSFVFIDKDGIVKLRKPAPWDVREISRSIDKTDLRIDELRDQREAG